MLTWLQRRPVVDGIMDHRGAPADPGQPQRAPVDDPRRRQSLGLVWYQAHGDRMSLIQVVSVTSQPPAPAAQISPPVGNQGHAVQPRWAVRVEHKKTKTPVPTIASPSNPGRNFSGDKSDFYSIMSPLFWFWCKIASTENDHDVTTEWLTVKCNLFNIWTVWSFSEIWFNWTGITSLVELK